MTNPFFYGNPIPPELFVGRKQEIRRVISRIRNQGQSTAIVGEPRSGKTSIMSYIASPEKRKDLYGERGERMFFVHLDAHMLGHQLKQAQFWEYALNPFHEQVILPNADSPIAKTYQTAQENQFGSFVLERLLAQMKLDEWFLVLLLDEFDALLHHPIFNSAEFFGSLRSLASRSQGALALVLASRLSLTRLNEATQEFSRTGSPYFNFLEEITLGPFSERAIVDILKRDTRFSGEDHYFINYVSGGHPYFVQAAASALWEIYEDEEADEDNQRRWQVTGETLYNQAEMIMSDTWHFWSPQKRKAFTAIALAHIDLLAERNELLEQRAFKVERLFDDMHDLSPERRELLKQGFIAEDKTIPGGWRVRPVVLLWWMADEVIRTVREDMPFEQWLRQQEWDGLVTKSEKAQLNQALQVIGNALKEGATTLIEAAAKGLGESWPK